MHSLYTQIRKGSERAIARAITILENGSHGAQELRRSLLQRERRCRVVGITGSPGAGKSTLVDGLSEFWSKRREKVAVLAVDPSSPFSGGALLGDRIRMARSENRSSVFIRSMASRGALGGLSAAVEDAIMVLSLAGHSIILIETVGVGQSEVEIAKTADSCVVVLVPGMGDTVQSSKAGILEIADILVINKADRDGANNLERDLREMIKLSQSKSGWTPRIVKTVATELNGISELSDKIAEHGTWLRSSKGRMLAKDRERERFIAICTDEFKKAVISNRDKFQLIFNDYKKGKIDPAQAIVRFSL